MNAAVFPHPEYAERLSKSTRREDLLRCADLIPMLSSVSFKVLVLVDAPNSDARELAEAIGTATRFSSG